jgi:hypothetical protein
MRPREVRPDDRLRGDAESRNHVPRTLPTGGPVGRRKRQQNQRKIGAL